ncbi:hypothetical protein T440DRAFT_130212 [Plenodomus tracheiphilus IPT5]|uniref:Uncharacterized protein n=1 Tax=Plenodomus tracheiphilus IPT5 TaxID=1408161 RepID=A0A6A7B550_9PLEO|nr:hypothetical protein T440DRAFT_130212 [Plenodomus tracheiphilus IPT5]
MRPLHAEEHTGHARCKSPRHLEHLRTVSSDSNYSSTCGAPASPCHSAPSRVPPCVFGATQRVGGMRGQSQISSKRKAVLLNPCTCRHTQQDASARDGGCFSLKACACLKRNALDGHDWLPSHGLNGEIMPSTPDHVWPCAITWASTRQPRKAPSLQTGPHLSILAPTPCC